MQVVVVIEFWAFFHPESHYWPPPEFDLICTEYLNALSFGEIEFIKKDPSGKHFYETFFCPLCYVENLLIFCSSWISCPIYVFIGLWSLVSHLPFFHEFIVIKKDTIHSLHIAKIPFYSTYSGRPKVTKLKKDIWTDKQTDIINRIFMIKSFCEGTMRSIIMQIWYENWWIWLVAARIAPWTHSFEKISIDNGEHNGIHGM